MKAFHFKINSMFASKSQLPTSFVASVVVETARAYKVYGHGEIDPAGSCARCGRTLTHPGSILLGIGPECLGDWGARDIRLDNVSEEDKNHLQALIRSQQVDNWIPKSIVKQKLEVAEEITIPDNVKQNGTHKKEAKKQAVQKGDRIKIIFPFSNETLGEVRGLNGRRYDPITKTWNCLITMENIEALHSWGFELGETLQKHLKKIEIQKQPIESIDIPDFKKPLMPFQKEGLGFLESRDGNALIGDEMGLGKTIQSLAYLELHREKRPVVIVCPASLKLNWKREIEQCMNDTEVEVLSGKSPYRTTKEILIINYDIISSWMTYLESLDVQVLITDECHFFKSNSALRTKAIKKLAKKIPHVIALSGTPILNRPIEIYNALTIIDPTVVSSFWEFGKRYCGAKHNGFGWDFGGATNTEELNQKLTQSVMIRRLKKDVLKDLPDKVRSFVPIGIDNRKEYQKLENDFIGYVKEHKGADAAVKASNAEVLAQIEYLKQLSIEGKFKEVVEWIKTFLSTGEKLVVFAIHRNVIDKLMKEFHEVAVKIDGSVSAKDRDLAATRFQEVSGVQLFVGNIKAAGVGLTLTAASNVAFIELPWTPGELSQAEDRCHRIGQKESVGIHYLLAEDTIEDNIAALLDKKRKVLDAVLDGQAPDEETLFSELIERYQS